MSPRSLSLAVMLMSLMLAGASSIGAESTVPFKVEVDNPAVQVVRIRLEPHASLPMHDLSDRVVVFLTDAHMRLTFPDGHTEEQRYHRGEAVWLSAQRHAGESLSDRPIEMIGVIPKAAHR